MNEELLALYRKYRAKYDLGARQALLWARSTLGRQRFEWTESRDGTAMIGRATIDGLDVKVKISDDEWADWKDVYGSFERSPKYGKGGKEGWGIVSFENPHFREYHKDAGTAWHVDRHGYRCEEHCGAQWYEDPSGGTFYELWRYLRKSYARHEAWLRAMQTYRKGCDQLHEAMQDRYGMGPLTVSQIEVSVSYGGVEMATECVGGYAWEREWGGRSLDEQLDEMAADVIYDAVRTAKADRLKVAQDLRDQAARKLEQALEVEAYA